MPIIAELRRHDDTVVAVAGEASDAANDALPEFESRDFPILAGIDRYGTTIFNTIQMELLVRELTRATRLVTPGSRSEALLHRLAELCRDGSEHAHWKLVFSGD